jgi:hypothetical protein
VATKMKLAGKDMLSLALAMVMALSSRGCLRASMMLRANSGNSSKNKTP